ncbi:hypothetical protein DVH24_019975 [Malus domestica]|uniref:Uncharacterized protein n=1 Tax=Malus domestica TaxID=3750 RepID=A0A498I563_MALDO|nr:hypothetical protein DVH24_019975 [Malus domestica]
MSFGGHEESNGVLTEFTKVGLTLGCYILVIVYLKLPNCVNGYVTLTEEHGREEPIANGYTRSDAESLESTDELKRKKRTKLAIYIDIFIVFQMMCAYAPTPEAFDVHLRVLKDEDGSIMRTFLDSLLKENWSNASFEGASMYGEMWSNVAESFNSWICEERSLPIYQLVDCIRVKMMEMNKEWFRATHNWNTFLCPEMEERFNQVLEVGRHWEISRLSLSVLSDGGFAKSFLFMLSMANQRVSYKHAVAANINDDGNPNDYVEDFFTVEYYKSSYSFPIYPIPNIDRPDIDGHEEIVVEPPLTKKQYGRPKLKMMKSIGIVSFLYQGATVGQVSIPKSKAEMLSTKKINVEVSLSSSELSGTNLGSEMSNGVLTLNSAAKLTGKVELMLIMKKSSTMDCTVAFDLSSNTLQSVAWTELRSWTLMLPSLTFGVLTFITVRLIELISRLQRFRITIFPSHFFSLTIE